MPMMLILSDEEAAAVFKRLTEPAPPIKDKATRNALLAVILRMTNRGEDLIITLTIEAKEAIEGRRGRPARRTEMARTVLEAKPKRGPEPYQPLVVPPPKIKEEKKRK